MQCYYCGKKRRTIHIKFCDKCNYNLPQSERKRILIERRGWGKRIRDYFDKTTEGNGK